MSKQQLQPIVTETQFSEMIERFTGQQGREIASRVDEKQIQQLMSLLIKIYVEKIKNGETVLPVSKDGLTGTETAVFVDQLLKQMDIELFEIQMWRSIGSNY